MPRSRLSDADRAELIARYRDGATGRELAAAFGVPHQHGALPHGRRWSAPPWRPRQLRTLQRALARHAPESVPVLLPAATERGRTPRRPALHLSSPAQRGSLRKRWRDGATHQALAAALGVSAATIAAWSRASRARPGPRRASRHARRRAHRAKRGYPQAAPGRIRGARHTGAGWRRASCASAANCTASSARPSAWTWRATAAA